MEQDLIYESCKLEQNPNSKASYLSGQMLIFQIDNVFSVLFEPFISGYHHHFLEGILPSL